MCIFWDVYILVPRYWGAGPRTYDLGRAFECVYFGMCIFWVHVTGGRPRARMAMCRFSIQFSGGAACARMTMDEPIACVDSGSTLLGGGPAHV